MVTVVLCIALVFVSIKWVLHISTHWCLAIILSKKVINPSDKEIEECTKFVLKNLLKRKK